jgi:hypothetical protein
MCALIRARAPEPPRSLGVAPSRGDPRMPGRGDAGGAVDVGADVPLAGQEGRAGVEAHPDRDRQRGLRLGRSGERPRGGRERDEEGVALRVDLTPPWRSKAERRTRRCASSAAAYGSAPSSCSSRVEPSMSVKRNVTVPLGSTRIGQSSCAGARGGGGARAGDDPLFEERGVAELEGVSGEWRLYALSAGGA